MHEQVERARFVPIDDANALDDLVERSVDGPVLLMSYDPYCPINRVARAELSCVDAEVYVVDVDAHHELGRLIERRTGVRHESPQLIVLKGGRATWSASHFAITAEAVEGALRSA
jgi:bacillithiol system protein YtxJ